jgi:hypothetical protein
VPPLAARISPCRSPCAPENAPRTCPNSSSSNRLSGSAAVDGHQRAGAGGLPVKELGEHLLADARLPLDEDLVHGASQPCGLRQLELPLGLQGRWIGTARDGLQVASGDPSRRAAEEEVGMADLEQVAVAEDHLLAGGDALPVEQRPVPGAFIAYAPGSFPAVEVRVTRRCERVAHPDAQGGCAALGGKGGRAADVDLLQGGERVARGRLGEVVRGDEPEQERPEGVRRAAALPSAVLERGRGIHPASRAVRRESTSMLPQRAFPGGSFQHGVGTCRHTRHIAVACRFRPESSRRAWHGGCFRCARR